MLFAPGLSAASSILSAADPAARTAPPPAATPEPMSPERDEISIAIDVPVVGTLTVPALVTPRSLFIAVVPFFQETNVYYEFDRDSSSISGFINRGTKYSIDLRDQIARCGSQTVSLDASNSIIHGTSVYLSSEAMGQLFGIRFAFHYRALSADLTSEIDLPIVAQARRFASYQNLVRRAQASSLPTINTGTSLLSVNALDWLVSNTYTGPLSTQTTYRGAIGGSLLGGNIWVSQTGTAGTIPAIRSTLWNWRAVPDLPFLRQISIGDRTLLPFPVSFHPFKGVKLTNAPRTMGGMFGEYVMQRYLPAGSTLELYRDRELVDYRIATADTIVRFAVPYSYGSTSFSAVEYGIHGEVDEATELLRVPMAQIPAGEVRYDLSAGFLSDDLARVLGQGTVSLGVTNSLSIEAGAQYYRQTGFTPFALLGRIQWNAITNVVLSADYVDQERAHLALDYLDQHGLSFGADYQYAPPVRRIEMPDPTERGSVRFRIPFTVAGMRMGLRARASEYRYGIGPRTIDGSLGYSASLFGVSLGAVLDAQLSASETSTDLLSSHTALTISLPVMRRSRLLGGVLYDNLNRQITEYSATLSTRISTVELGLRAQKSMGLPLNAQLMVGVNLPFVSAFGSGTAGGGAYSTSNSLQGSLRFGQTPADIEFLPMSAVSTSTVLFRPFLDRNGNGIKDENEPIIPNVDVDNSGGTEQHRSDGTVRITGLSSDGPVVFSCHADRVEEPTLRLEHNQVAVNLLPDATHSVDLPLYAASEVMGTVRILDSTTLRRHDRVVVVIRDSSTQEVGHCRVEDDGTFYFSGLHPGTYTLECNAPRINGHAAHQSGKNTITVPRADVGELIENVVVTIETN